MKKNLSEIESLVQKGARVVISLIPVKRETAHSTISAKSDEENTTTRNNILIIRFFNNFK